MWRESKCLFKSKSMHIFRKSLVLLVLNVGANKMLVINNSYLYLMWVLQEPLGKHERKLANEKASPMFYGDLN